jgi:hypothetical protein
MDVGSAKAIAREWIEANRQDWPDLRAAHLVGGIITMPDDAPFPATKDGDVHLFFTDGTPALRAEGFFLNIVAAEFGELLFEAGVKPVADYASPEVVLVRRKQGCVTARDRIRQSRRGRAEARAGMDPARPRLRPGQRYRRWSPGNPGLIEGRRRQHAGSDRIAFVDMTRSKRTSSRQEE